MKVLVTGGAGFIGSHLVERLVDLKHEVIVIDDLSNGSLSNLKRVSDGIQFLHHDISHPLFNKVGSMDVIYHLACFPRSMSLQNPQRDVEVNVKGMVNVLELAKLGNSTRVIFSSNSGIYDTTRIPINEMALDDPKTPYDLNKLHAERFLKLYSALYDIEFVIFRFGTVYGPRQKSTEEWKPVIAEFINCLSKNQEPTIYWDGEQTRDFIHVNDIVDALVLTLENSIALRNTMILGSGIETSINNLYEMVCNLLDVTIEPVRGPKQMGDIRRMLYDCSKAKLVLNWKAQVKLEEGLQTMIHENTL